MGNMLCEFELSFTICVFSFVRRVKTFYLRNYSMQVPEKDSVFCSFIGTNPQNTALMIRRRDLRISVPSGKPISNRIPDL